MSETRAIPFKPIFRRHLRNRLRNDSLIRANLLGGPEDCSSRALMVASTSIFGSGVSSNSYPPHMKISPFCLFKNCFRTNFNILPIIREDVFLLVIHRGLREGENGGWLGR